MLLLTAPCVVEMQSVGYWESESAYVKLNSYFAMELTSPDDENDKLNPSGIYTVLLDKVISVIASTIYRPSWWLWRKVYFTVL